MKLSYSRCGSMDLRALAISLWTHTTSSWSRLDRSKYSCRISFLWGGEITTLLIKESQTHAETTSHFSWAYGRQWANDTLSQRKIAEVWRGCHENFATLIILRALCTSLYFNSLAKAKVKNVSTNMSCEMWNICCETWLSFTATVNSP